MSYAIFSFPQAKAHGLPPAWGYDSWEQLESECYDYEALNGLWHVMGADSEFIAADGGEPEDQTLSRDWAWVATALNTAYQEGWHAGLEKALKDQGVRVAG